MEAGYKVIDLKGVEILSNGAAVTVEGVYDRIESSFKTILLTNLIVDGLDIKPTFINVAASGTKYTATLLAVLDSEAHLFTVYTVIFDEDDGVSVESHEIAVN